MKYLTIDDVCEMLSISRRTLERMRVLSAYELLQSIQQRNPITSDLNDTDIKNETERLSFPEPDLFIGKSPRWEQDKLISWLQINGKKLKT